MTIKASDYSVTISAVEVYGDVEINVPPGKRLRFGGATEGDEILDCLNREPRPCYASRPIPRFIVETIKPKEIRLREVVGATHAEVGQYVRVSNGGFVKCSHALNALNGVESIYEEVA